MSTLNIPQGDVAARMRKYRSKGSDIEVAEYQWSSKKHRVRTHLDFIEFCKHYFPHLFKNPDGPDQIESKQRIQHCILNGGLQAEAAPRGDGKSQRAIAGGLWALLNGHWHFVAMIAATADFGKKLLDDMIKELADNDRLADDWPEICLPLREAYGKPQRAMHITVNGSPCRLECKKNLIVLPTSGCCIGAPKVYEGSLMMSGGISGAMRGMRYKTENGETLRPDGALIDDIQTRKTASSAPAVEKTLSIVRGDIMRLGGQDKEAAVLAMVTVIAKKDAADRMLNHKECPEWRGIRKAMVVTWPTSKKWDEYMRLYAAGLLEGDTSAATEFYVLNRAEMDEGAVVAWESRKEGRISAIQLAYDLRVKMKDAAFFAECMNEPIEHTEVLVKLSADIIMQRVNNLPPGVVPPEAQVITGFIDPNDHALAWMMCAWWNKGGLTGSILGYGEWGRNGNGRVGDTQRSDPIWDEKTMSGDEAKRLAFWNALTALDTWLFTAGRWTRGGQSVTPALVLVDVGYSLFRGDDTVYRWLGEMAKQRRFSLGYSRGYPSTRFRAEMRAEGERFDSIAAHPSEWWREDRWKIMEGVKGLPHDADYHKKETQGSLQLGPGAPGSVTIYGSVPEEHTTLAQQLASEQLVAYKESDKSFISGFYKYNTVPGIRQEAFDTLRGCRLGGLYLLRGSIGGSNFTVLPPAPPSPTAPHQPGPYRPPSGGQPSQPVRRPRRDIQPLQGW